jgi:hypothetical protein
VIVMCYLLRAVRLLQRLKCWSCWSLGPRTPDSFNDCYALLSAVWRPLHYAAPLELIPSPVAITAAPRYYFRRLPVIVSGKKSIYKTPTSFSESSREFLRPRSVFPDAVVISASSTTRKLWGAKQ